LHIVVIAKSVPDTEAAVTVNADGSLNRGDKLVTNPWDEYAITEAVLLKDAHGGQVTILTVGTDEQQDVLKHGLAVGCDQAVRIWDEALHDHDGLAYATAVTAAINKLGDVDLVIFGKELSDIASDQHIAQTARKLGWELFGFVAQIEMVDPGARTIRVVRQVEQGAQVISGALPTVISVLKDINEPKYPTFIGIRKAGKAQIPVWGLAELGLDAGAVSPQTAVTGYRELPQREGTVEIIEGTTAQAQAEALVDKLLGEKVL
jgi:electron transfer flavoprotein beta subunit